MRSALVASLGTGNYTAVVRGANNSTGVGLGGQSASARNVISGNFLSGVQLGLDGDFEGSTSHNIVAGNFIGTDKNGTKSLPNGTSTEGFRAGVLVTKRAGSNLIGGRDGLGRNVISGNQGPGVVFVGSNSPEANSVFGNYIGTQLDGITPLPNQGSGVQVSGGSKNVAIGS